MKSTYMSSLWKLLFAVVIIMLAVFLVIVFQVRMSQAQARAPASNDRITGAGEAIGDERLKLSQDTEKTPNGNAESYGYAQLTYMDSPDIPAATISGIVTHDSNPLANATVTVVWESGYQLVNTGADGSFNVSGIPLGGWVTVRAEPPPGQKLVTHNWETGNLSGDTVKNFELEDGYRVTGEYHTPEGIQYTGGPPAIVPIELRLPKGESFGPPMDADGYLDLILPPGHFAIINEPGFKPYFVRPTILDMTGGDISGLVINLQYRPEPAPIIPPIADLIQVGIPDIEGYANIVGQDGSVGSNAAVVVINLNTHTLNVTVSDENGAFSTILFAPPGSTLMVKYDPSGDQVASVWSRSVSELPGDATLNSLPGTIIYTGNPPPGTGTMQSFQAVGAWEEQVSSPTLAGEDMTVLEFAAAEPKPEGRWAGWWISGTLQVPNPLPGQTSSLPAVNGLPIQPGQPLTLTVQLRVTSPAIECTEPLTYTPALQPTLLLKFGPDGWADYWGTWFTSYLFTPTGLPIERESFGERIPLEEELYFTNLTCLSSHTFEAELTHTMTVPEDAPEGIYVPYSIISAGGVPLAPTPLIPVWYDYIPGVMPPIRVGDPMPPRIPWTLLGDYPVNGHRGVLAREDVGRFAMPTRVVHPPGQVVIPRLDERTGELIAYRLEPGSNWISSTDRRQPNPPQIPFAFPSGELIVEVVKPDESVDQLGPAPITQSSVRTPTTPGGALINEGTGYIGDIYRLTTLDDSFAYTFDQYGHHTIQLSGFIEDVYDNSYSIQGTYDVFVARILDLDPAQLPTTPYMQGDAFAPGVHLFPPVPADVTVEVVHMPYSDAAQKVQKKFTGQANRFGYFQPPSGSEFRFDTPGEFRAEVSAVYEDPDGTLWMGAMTWGGVVEATNAQTKAHGRRGMDLSEYRLPWYELNLLPPEGVGLHYNYPYFSGDVHWGTEDMIPGDSIQAIVTLEDTTPAGTLYDLIRNFATKQHTYIEGDLEEMIADDEVQLFTPSKTNHDPGVFPEDIELFAYWYGSSQRPDVRVRELINIGNMPTAYWRFNDTYGYQIGEPADGDQPGDIKWEFGGVVFRVISETNPINEYAIYSSFWTLMPHGCDAYGCARVTPPFQDEAKGTINGGPILTIGNEEIDMLFLPKGVRPGDILVLGDVVSFSGHVGPPLDSRVAVTITAPGGTQHIGEWHANKIGWLYNPAFDFPANELGRWTVEVFVEHDRPYLPTGYTPADHNTGTVLGTSGTYEFYVVEPDSPELGIITPNPGFIIWPNYEIEPIRIQGVVPEGTTTVYYTIHDKGVVMGQGMLTPDALGRFTLVYDPETLHDTFSMLSLTAHEGRWEGLSDEVAVDFLAVGGEGIQAAAVTLIGEEVFLRNTASVFGQFLPAITR